MTEQYQLYRAPGSQRPNLHLFIIITQMSSAFDCQWLIDRYCLRHFENISHRNNVLGFKLQILIVSYKHLAERGLYRAHLLDMGFSGFLPKDKSHLVTQLLQAREKYANEIDITNLRYSLHKELISNLIKIESSRSLIGIY